MKKWKIEAKLNKFEVYHKERPRYNVWFKEWKYKETYKSKEEAEVYIKSHKVYYYD